MLVAVCSSGYYFFLHRELVRELTLAVQSQSIKKAIKMLSLLGKAASQILSYPVFFRH